MVGRFPEVVGGIGFKLLFASGVELLDVRQENVAQRALVDLERGIVDALVIVLRPVEHDGAAFEHVGTVGVR